MRDTQVADTRRTAVLSPQERRTILTHMVRMELDQGPLRYARWRQLVRFGVDLGIPEHEAGMLIAQARQNFGRGETLARGTLPYPELLAAYWSCPRWLKIMLAGVLVLLADLLLICITSV